MRYEFNIHEEFVYHVEIESDKPREEVYASLVKAYREKRLDMGEGDWVATEFWDSDEGTCFDEVSQWG